MGKFRGFMGKAVTVALAAAMLLQGTALAAPVDELNEIFEKQNEAASQSMLEETLGLSELGKAIAESGLNFQMKTGMAEGTAEALDMGEDIPEDGYVSFGLQVDPAQAAWALTAAAGSGEQSILDLILYGDRQQLALTVPQFFAGAVALSAGNLKEQYENSALAEMLGGAENVPDIDLSFYPAEDGLDDIMGPFAGLQERIEEKAEEMSDSLQVDKTEDGDTVTYTVTVGTEDIMEIYSIILTEYISAFDDMGLLTGVDDMSAVEYEIEDMIGQMGSVLGDAFDMDFVTKNGLLEEIRYELYCDTTVLSDAGEDMTEIVEEELAPAGNAEDAAGAPEDAEAEDQAGLDVEEIVEEIADAENAATESADGSTGELDGEVIGGADGPVDITIESEDFQGYISYDIVFYDPEDVSRGFYMNMVMKDMEDAELATFYMDWNRTEDGSAEKYSCTIDMTEEGETVYSATPFTATFDSATGDLDVVLAMEDDDGNGVTAKLDSTFSQIEKGKSFVWNIDSLALDGDGEQIGVNTEIQVSADPGELPAPQDVRELLKLTDTEISSLVQEIQMKAITWYSQFVPESETEVETEAELDSAI